MQIMVAALRQSKQAEAEGCITSSPDWEWGVYGGFRFLIAEIVVPKFDGLIQRTGGQLAGIPSVPIDTINLCFVCSYGLQSMGTFSDIPDLQKLVVGGSKDVGIDPVPFDLSSTSEPVTEGHCWLFGRTAQIPAEHVAVNGAGGKNIRMVSGEVDVGYCAFMAMQNMLDRRCSIDHVQVPDEGFLIGGAHHPIIAACKWGPLYICDLPRSVMW